MSRHTSPPPETVWPPAAPTGSADAAESVDFDVAPTARRFLADRSARALATSLLPDTVAIDAVVKLTASICPHCLAAETFAAMTVPMVIYEAEGAIRVRKRCADHGHQTDVVWADADRYHRAAALDARSRVAALEAAPSADATDSDADDCCAGGNTTASGIGNIVVTNRCDRSCHYCFFYADTGDPLYEPSVDAFRRMAARLGADGVGAIQLTGGEPLVREDLPRLVEIAAEHADQVLLNTHAGRFAADPGLAHELSAAGARGLYTSFDGTTPQTNTKSYWEFPHALAATHDAGMCAMLVPTVIGGWNDDALGDIVRFGAANADTVCGVNFQPVSFVGRMDDATRRQQRITIPEVIDAIEDDTDGAVPADAWLPLPVYRTIAAFLRQWTGEGLYGVTSNFSAWMVTAVFVDGDELVPVTDVVDVEALLTLVREAVADFGPTPSGLDRARLVYRLLGDLDALLGPRSDGLRELADRTLRRGRFDGLSELYDGVLPLGVRHFQDQYNFDLDALPDSDVHYAMPDGRVVPFSVYNTVPELYRDRSKREHAISVDEWLDREYTTLTDASAPDRVSRSSEMVDPDGEAGVFGADITARRDYDAAHRDVVESAYQAAIESLEPVWSVIDVDVDADVDTDAGCATAGCCDT